MCHAFFFASFEHDATGSDFGSCLILRRNSSDPRDLCGQLGEFFESFNSPFSTVDGGEATYLTGITMSWRKFNCWKRKCSKISFFWSFMIFLRQISCSPASNCRNSPWNFRRISQAGSSKRPAVQRSPNQHHSVLRVYRRSSHSSSQIFGYSLWQWLLI